jgi:hypothetical protein
MPKNSYADLTLSWSILTKALENDVLEPGVDACRRELESALGEVMERQHRQDVLRGQMVANTRQLHEAIDRGKDAEERLRAFLKGTYGGKSNQLIRFGLRPRRARRRASASDESGAAEPEAPEMPAEAVAAEVLAPAASKPARRRRGGRRKLSG